MTNRTYTYTPAEAEVANAKDYLRDALNRRTNDIGRAKRWLAEAEAALAAEQAVVGHPVFAALSKPTRQRIASQS